MFNQFHDIICGCSIEEAYQDARECYGEALNIGAEILNASAQKISWAIDTMGNEIMSLSKEKDWMLWEDGDKGVPLVVFNPLSWNLNAPIQVNKLIRGVIDECGNAQEVQKIRGPQSNRDDKWNSLFMGDIPPFGYKVYWVYRDKEPDVQSTSQSLSADCAALENDYLKLEIEPHTGFIKKLYDKKNRVDIFRGCGAIPIVIDMHHCDTWAHGVPEFRKELGKFSDADVKLIESGPIRARLRVTSRYNDSTIRQDFILYKNKPDIEVRVKLDWREKHKMLKLSFPVNIETPKATCEIPYGYMEKPVDGIEVPAQQWVDITGKVAGKEDQLYGLSLLNDCKYSFDIKDNDLRMTVVNSPIFADHFSERDDLCEFMDQGLQEFKYMLVPHSGAWKDANVVRKAYELNVQPVTIMETYHTGSLPQKFEGISISSDNVIATVLKRAEDNNGYILRSYETTGRETDTVINIPMLNRKWEAKFGRCEIKTFWIPDNPDEIVSEKNLLEI